MEGQGDILIVGWLIFSLVVGALGSDKTIGFLGGFLISILLSPVIGLIIVLTSKTKAQKAAELTASLHMHQPVQKIPTPPPLKTKNIGDIHDQLEKLESMKEKKLITQDEYESMRKEIIKF